MGEKKSTEFWVGVVGYSSQKFNEKVAKALIIKAFDEVEEDNPGCDIWIVSGLTDLGIPAIAYREAKRRGWKTMGVACEKAKEYDLFPVDETIIEGKDWGDESERFLSAIDALVKIGGGKQSAAERDAAKAKGLPVSEFELVANQ